MKKIMNFFVFVAATAMALVSCNKQEVEAPRPQELEYEYTFEIAGDTKAAIGDDCVVWESGDQIGVYTDGQNGVSYNRYGNITLGSPVTFKVSSYYALVAGDMVHCYYPYVRTNSQDPKTVELSIPASQTEKNQMPMVSLPYAVTENLEEKTDSEKSAGEISFVNLGSVIEFHVYSTTEAYQAELVKSVTFTADQAIAGSFAFDLTAVDYSKEETLAISGYEAKTVVSTLSTSTQVSADKNAATVVKMVVAPGSYTGNVVVTTDKATYTYPISTAKEFKRSAVKPLGVNLKAENRTENTVDDYSGSYAIVAKSGEKFYYLTNVDSGASTKRLSSMEISSLPEENANLDASVVWNLIAKGDGTYYIQSAENNLYLDHNAKTDNSATLEQTTSTVVSLNVEPTEDGRYMISYENITEDKTEVRNFVKNSQDPYFAFYTSTQCGAVYLIPAVAVKIPAIQIETVVLAESEGGEVSLDYTIKNPAEGKNLTATETSDWLSVTVAEGKVTFNIDENKVEEERTATVTLAYEGAESVVVTVTQAAMVAAGVVEKEVVIDMTAQGFSNQQEVSSVKKNPISVEFNKGTNSNAPKYYTSGTAVRVYGGSYFIVSSVKTIVKVVVTFGSSDGSNAISTDCGTYGAGTWTGSSNAVKFSIAGTSGNRRIQKVAVTYQEAASDGGDTPADPVLSVTTTEVIVGAAGGNGEIAYSVENAVDGMSVSAATSVDWITDFNYSTEGKVTFAVSANTGAERSANVTLTYPGAEESKIVTVKQEAAQSGGAKTISFKLNQTVTGSTSTSYVQDETIFTYDGIQYAVNNWNPNNLQIRGNQTSQTNMQSGKNFYLRNKTAIPGKITSIKVEYTSGSLVATSIYAATSTSQITNQTTSASKKGTAATNAVIWDFDANGGYFAIGMQKGGTSGTAISGTITITYEEN